MRKLALLGWIALTSCAASHAAQIVRPAAPAAADGNSGDRISLAFSDPSRPGQLQVNLNNGAISVKAYKGTEVIVEADTGERRTATQPAAAAGLHRIDAPASGLRVEEENNVMTITAALPYRPLRVNIQVPSRTNLRLRGVNGGRIEVDGVDGDIEINNANGRIRAENVSGSVLAHSVNGGVVVSMRSVTPGKALSFISTNGSVDVTLPADTKANARIRTTHGEIWTDFEMQMKSSPAAVTEDSGRSFGTHRIVVDRNLYGEINGGGPDLTLITLNGSIYIRKGK